MFSFTVVVPVAPNVATVATAAPTPSIASIAAVPVATPVSILAGRGCTLREW